MSRILLLTDFSEAAKNALDYAVGIAEAIGDTVTLLHAYTLDVSAKRLKKEVFKEKKEEKENSLRSLFSEFVAHLPTEVPFKYELIHGDFAEEAVHFANKHEYECIIMAMKASTNFRDFLFGNSSENIIQNTKIPLLLIPANVSYKGFKKLVYSCNFIHDNILALQDLDDLASLFDAKITFLHIDDHITVNDQRIAQKYKRALKKLLKNPFHLEVIEHEDIGQSIVRYINNHNIDLLAMLKKERGLTEKMFYTSLIKTMIANSPKPLLILQEESTLGN